MRSSLRCGRAEAVVSGRLCLLSVSDGSDGAVRRKEEGGASSQVQRQPSERAYLRGKEGAAMVAAEGLRKGSQLGQAGRSRQPGRSER